MADRPQLDPEDVAALEEMAQWWRDREDGGGQSMTRRKMLGLLGGAGLGAASVGGFFAGEASAGTDSVGQIGTQSEPADAVLEDVMDSGGNNPMSFPGDGSVSIEKESINQLITSMGWAANGTSQTIASGSNVLVNWTEIVNEDQDIATASLANDQITVQESGHYMIKGFCQFASDSGWSTGDRAESKVFVNGTRVSAPQDIKIGTTGQLTQFYWSADLSAGDTVSIRVFQTSGADKQLKQGSGIADELARFDVIRLG